MSGLKNVLRHSSVAVGLIRGLRADWTGLKRLYWSSVQKEKLRQYIRDHPLRKLQLGTGENVLPDWLNTDLSPSDSRKIFFLDATKRFPFSDKCFDYILSEHQIEHLTFREGIIMMQECHRILKPGAKIRIATPDLRSLAKLFMETTDTVSSKFVQFVTNHLIQEDFLPKQQYDSLAFVMNNAFYNPEWQHKFLYDLTTLSHSMEQCGFTDLRQFRSGESADENLKGVEGHGRRLGDEEINQFETMVLEGTRALERQ